MPIVVPGSSGQTGQPDAYFAQKVRRAIRDLPAVQSEKYPTDGTTGGPVAGAKPFRLQHQPITAGSVILAAPGGAPGWTIDYNDPTLPPQANHVSVNTDTGELSFGSAPPAAGTLAVTYQSTRFTDDQILDALLEGMNNLWPEIWNPVTDTTSLSIISPIQFEYALNAIFGDQRTIILDLEYSPPPFFQFFRTSMWRQTLDINSPKLIFAKLPPIASIVRLTYTQTFQSLAAMPPQMQHLAKYYAIGFLMALGETMRTRADDLAALTAENANPPGTSLQAAAWWLQQYDVQLKRFGMTEPTRMTVRNRTVERLGLSSFWLDDS
jgi:hypothetical protein